MNVCIIGSIFAMVASSKSLFYRNFYVFTHKDYCRCWALMAEVYTLSGFLLPCFFICYKLNGISYDMKHCHIYFSFHFVWNKGFCSVSNQIGPKLTRKMLCQEKSRIFAKGLMIL